MKKIFALATLAFLLTGCFGNKESTVSCTRSTDKNGFTLVEKSEMVIKNKKAYSAEFEITTTPAENRKAYLETYANTLDKGFPNLKDAKGITYVSDLNADKHVLRINIEYSKLSEDEITKFNSNEKQLVSDRSLDNVSAEITKTNLEKDGYTCEIK